MAVQSLNECEGEVVADSDDEMMLSSERVVLTTSDALGFADTFCTGFRHGSCLKSGEFGPSTEQDISGHSPKVLSSVYVPSSPGSCLVTPSITYLENDNQCKNQTVFQDDEISRVEHQLTTVHDNKECGGEMEDTIDRLYAASLDDTESQEPGALSNALEYVEKFLSGNNVASSEIVDTVKTLKDKPTPLYNLKGSQSLAKYISLRSSGRETSSFEWVDDHLHGARPSLTNKIDSLFDCEELGTRPHGATNEVSCGLGALCEEKEKYHSVEKTGSTCKDSRFASDELQVNKKLERVFEARIGRNLIEEFDEESSGQQFEPGTGRDDDDIFEGIFNTQMAAEVMETLLPSVDASNSAFTDRSNSFLDSSSCLTKDKTSSEHPLSKRVSFLVPGFNGKNSKQLKIPAMNISKQSTTPAHSNEMKKAKALAEKDENCRMSVNMIESPGMSKMKKPVDGDITKDVEQNCDLVTLIEHVAEGKSEVVYTTFSPIAHQTRNAKSKPLGVLKRTKDPVYSSGYSRSHISKIDIKNKRKRNSSSISRRRHPKVGHYITGEARSSKQTQEEQTSISLHASASFLKHEVWSFPKGKRTSRNRPNHLSRIRTIHGQVTPVGSKQDTCQSANNMIIIKDSSQTKFQGSAEANLGMTLHMENIKKPGSADIVSPGSGPMYKEKDLINLTRTDASVQSGRPSTLESISSTEAAEENFMFEHLSNEEFNQRCSQRTVSYNQDRSKESRYKPYGYLKRPCSRNLPRAFLVKELFGLGVPHVIPETSNYLRKRRDVVDIRVLFSQHLDDVIIKYQKRIMRRLGISTASSSLDATHFIADKFSRTRNMLEAMALGKPVVTHLWLESCGLASCYLNEKRYILRDAKKEREFGFEMPVSLARASQHPLLKGYKVFVTSKIRPGIEMIASLIKAVQGLVVEKLEDTMLDDEKIPGEIIVLSCEEDYQRCVPFLNKGVAVYDSELLLNGIVTQKLEYERHQLFVDHVKNCSGIVKKRRKTA